MFVEFFLQNAVLAAVVAALGGATIYMWTLGGDKSFLDTDSAIAAMNFENALAIDIRPRAEYDKGHIPGARHVEPDAVVTKVPQLAKSKPVVLVCSRGNISAEKARKLKAGGFETASVLKGGMTAWQQDGKPITHK